MTKNVLSQFSETLEEAPPPAEGKRVIVQCELPSELEVTLYATATCEVTVTETSTGGDGGCNVSALGILAGIAVGFAGVTTLKK